MRQGLEIVLGMDLLPEIPNSHSENLQHTGTCTYATFFLFLVETYPLHAAVVFQKKTTKS